MTRLTSQVFEPTAPTPLLNGVRARVSIIVSMVTKQATKYKVEDYHIGWICALPLELAAAASLLDEEHESIPQNALDSNSYTLGRIGGHNIVMACLPLGKLGTISAAQVAVQMHQSFYSIRFGLLVGIGGAAPSESHDIRLGDIVVSKPYGSYGGVIQYDFGATIDQGSFEIYSRLNSPPDVLLNALGKLASNHSYQDSAIPQILEESWTKWPKRRKACTSPGPDQDVLFEHGYRHVKPENKTCSGCDRSKIVNRPLREDQIAIHYGLIASGNQVMRDGITREKLRKQLDVLCFEMEASGLMDRFPCVVIRGICDYSDSHKNKQWQDYAAATAAAYAKELLGIIPADKVSRTSSNAEPSGSTSIPGTTDATGVAAASLYPTDPPDERHEAQKRRLEALEAKMSLMQSENEQSLKRVQLENDMLRAAKQAEKQSPQVIPETPTGGANDDRPNEDESDEDEFHDTVGAQESSQTHSTASAPSSIRRSSDHVLSGPGARLGGPPLRIDSIAPARFSVDEAFDVQDSETLAQIQRQETAEPEPIESAQQSSHDAIRARQNAASRPPTYDDSQSQRQIAECPEAVTMKRSLFMAVQQRGLQYFYPPQSPYINDFVVRALQEPADFKKAAKISEMLTGSAEMMALYDVAVFLDDSGSMQFEENGERIPHARAILTSIATAVTTFATSGVDPATLAKDGDHCHGFELRFMNFDDPLTYITSTREIAPLIKDHTFKGLTRIALAFKSKIIDEIFLPSLTDMRRPLLVIIITDGQPAGERKEDLFGVLKGAMEAAARSKYGAGALALQFVQVGNDLNATDFINNLTTDLRIRPMMHAGP